MMESSLDIVDNTGFSEVAHPTTTSVLICLEVLQGEQGIPARRHPHADNVRPTSIHQYNVNHMWS